MTVSAFVHEHLDFEALLSIVSERRGVSVALSEKDYWVTHTLWALEARGVRVWFKGGTSLSKGFGLIERFSEDLDTKLDAAELPPVGNWRSEGAHAKEERRRFFEALQNRMRIPGAEVSELAELRDEWWRNAVFAVRYPSQLASQLPAGIRPFVQIEVGSARVTPAEDRPISSWIHDYLHQEAPAVASTVLDNRPTAIGCVRPEVTLLEKIEAIARRYVRDPFEPATFVRHYEDVVRILTSGVIAVDEKLRALLKEMTEARDVTRWPAPTDVAFDPEADSSRWRELERAWAAIDFMFWGERIPLRRCATEIRNLLGALSR